MDKQASKILSGNQDMMFVLDQDKGSPRQVPGS
jgi:hypothetical protein